MIKKIKKIYMDISSSCNVLGLFEGLYVWCIRFTAQHLQNKKLIEKKHFILKHFIEKKYTPLIKSSDVIDETTPMLHINDKINIWFFWFQGYKDMPDIVNKCYIQLCQTYSDNKYIIHFIHKNNIDKYIQFPQYIKNKLANGDITLTHFSDILRFALLYHYSGLWIDSTIWCEKEIPLHNLENSFWTIKLPVPNFTVSPSNYRWSIFILYFKERNNILAKEVLTLLLEYWKNENKLVDYLLIDYFFDYSLKHLSLYRSIDEIEESNLNLYKLAENIYEDYSPTVWEKLKSSTYFFKLTYKGAIISKAQNNPKSYYYKVIKKCID